MQTRIAQHKDFNALVRLSSELHDRDMSSEVTPEEIDQFIDNPNRAIVCVVDEKDVVQGSAIVNLSYKFPNVECRLDEVIVSDRVRGQGLGRVLMDAVETWAWEHDADTIEFTSRPSREAANALYQKLGYKLRETNVYQKRKADDGTS